MLNDLFRIFSDEVQSNVGDLPIFENFEKNGKNSSQNPILKNYEGEIIKISDRSW